MSANDILKTIADNNGNITIKTAKDMLKELNVATVALRRINFLSKTFGGKNFYLSEIEKISKDALGGVKDANKT